MTTGPVRTPVRQRKVDVHPRRRVLWATLAGLLVTPILFAVIGATLFLDRRTSGHYESGAQLLVIRSVVAAVLGAAYWGVVTAYLQKRGALRRHWLLAAWLFVVAVIGAHVVIAGT